jgi:hypothetical protein
MNDYPAIGIKETVEVLESGVVRSLSDIHNIEAALELIKKSREKIAQFKEIKRKRIEAVDVEVENLEGRIAFLQSVIAETLRANNERSITFPGLGKVRARVKKGAWVINDEDELKRVLRDEGEYDAIVKKKEVIQKLELNKLLDMWEKIGRLPNSVDREESTDSVTLSFEDETPNAA